MHVYDVLVVGAGPAGAATACFLAQQGLEVLLADKFDFPRDKTCGDALSPRALRVLRRMGVLETVLAAGHRVAQAALVMPDGRRIQALIPPAGGLPDFVVVLPRLKLDDLLRRRAVAAGAVFRPRVNVVDVLSEAGRVLGVRAATPEGLVELRAQLTILATGAATAVLERARLLPRPRAFGRAARAYYKGVRGPADAIEFHFEAVPLPGYGWIFPTSPTTANVGAGYLAPGRARGRRLFAGLQAAPDSSPVRVMDAFTVHPLVAGRLAGARREGPAKGYPLRFDFPDARLALPGLALAGEACGLVNPLTGEGIDYALESAEVAGEVLGPAVRAGGPRAAAEQYARALRARFLRGFVGIRRVRDLYLRPAVLNRLGAVAARDESLRSLLIRVALGGDDPLRAMSPRLLGRILTGW